MELQHVVVATANPDGFVIALGFVAALCAVWLWATRGR
jgi:hypothetical protein